MSGWPAVTVVAAAAMTAALALALALALLASLAEDGVFLVALLGAAVPALPATAATLLAPSDALAALCLVPVLFLPLAIACRRLPRGLWRAARGLGGSRRLVATAILLPPLAPAIAVAAALAAAILAARVALGR